MDRIRQLIRDVPDFPKEGIVFKDITTLLKSPEGLNLAVEAMHKMVQGRRIDKVAGIESRGFIFGTPLAVRMGLGFIPIRKPHKLPAETLSQSYDLEYGTDTIEIHRDAVGEGESVLIVDDLLATGGTARAAASLIEKAGGRVAGIVFLIELTFLNGREKLREWDCFSIIEY